MKKVIILFMSCFATFVVAAQGPSCASLLKESLKKMKNAPGKSYRLKYSVTTHYRGESRLENYTTDADVIVKDDKSSFVSGDLEVYKDDRYMVSIDKESKVIYLSNAIKKDWKKTQIEALSIIHDSLFTRLQIVECKENSSIQNISTVLPEPYVQITGIKNISYWIDRDTKQITRFSITYANHPSGIQLVDLVIKQFDYDYRGEAYAGPALAKVLSKSQSPLSKYKGYRVKDIR
jgi:hypothetical protein